MKLVKNKNNLRIFWGWDAQKQLNNDDLYF